MGEIVSFRGMTRLDLDPDTVLEKTKGELKHVVIMGLTHENKYWFSSTMADGGDVLWMLEHFKHHLMDMNGNDS